MEETDEERSDFEMEARVICFESSGVQLPAGER